MIAEYPVDPTVVPGGVTAVAHTLARGLARRSDIELHIIACQKDVDVPRREERDGAQVHFVPNSDRWTQLLDWRVQRRDIARTLRGIPVDLVHAQGLGLTTAAAIDSGLPFLVSLHGILWKEASMTHPSWKKRWRGKLRAQHALKQLLRTKNVFITSAYASEMLPTTQSYREFVVRNPAPDDLFTLENRPTSPPHILFVGGTRHRKDPLTALGALEGVSREHPGVTMSIVGPPSNTPFDEEVRRAVIDRGLGNRVSIRGLISDLELREEYARASLLLLTSLEETAPVALGEACAVGLPQVGTDAGGIPDLLRHGETGFVCPVKDAAALAERMGQILGDAELRSRFAKRAREVGRAEFSLDAIAEKTVAAYREVLAESTSSRSSR